MSKILLRSSWQTVNIGDIGHTPGMLTLLREHLPEADIVLWASHLDRGVGEMLAQHFPEVGLYESATDADGLPVNPDLRQQWEDADFFLHGSGPSLVAHEAVRGWVEFADGGPWGAYGITVENLTHEQSALLNTASFLFFRDTTSLGHVRRVGIEVPVVGFGPDATFASRERDENTAVDYLRRVGLEAGGFLVVIPRLRYTPYFQIHGRRPTEHEAQRYEVSMRHKDEDHSKMREVMTQWVRESGLPVLICPEMTYQIDLAKELLIDLLPADIREKTVWRDTYWRPDEAASVYARAAVLVSYEMHSPILAFGVGTPAIYVRQPTDTCKGQMWRDVGFGDWMFEIDDCTAEEIAERALEIQRDPQAAAAMVARSQARVVATHRDSMRRIQEIFKHGQPKVAYVSTK